MAENADDFIAGWASGVAGLALTQPVDFVLTRMQSGRVAASEASVLGMFRGAMPLFATVPLNNAMLMYGYGVGKSVSESRGESSLMPIFVGGCAGGFAQSFLQSPVELLKVRLQLAAAGQQPSTSALTLELLRPSAEGAAAAPAAVSVPPLLSRGLYATLLRDVVPHGVWFLSYDWAKKKLEQCTAAASPATQELTEPHPLGVVEQLSAGAYAAVAAWVVGYPADVIKTRCQMEGGYASVNDAARSIYREGGVRAFYNGLGLKLLRAVPQSAAGFFVYEYVMGVLTRGRTSH